MKILILLSAKNATGNASNKNIFIYTEENAVKMSNLLQNREKLTTNIAFR